MNALPQQPKQNWRRGVVFGVTIALCLVVTKAVEKALTLQLGDWGAFGVSLLVLVVVAGVVGMIAQMVSSK